MPIAKAVLFTLAALAGTIQARKPKVHHSDKNTGNPQQLLDCLNSLKGELEKHPKRADFRRGFTCGAQHWQFEDEDPPDDDDEFDNGFIDIWWLYPKWKTLKVYKICESQLKEAAAAGTDWMKCALKSTVHESVISWAPVGTQFSYWSEKMVDDLAPIAPPLSG